MANQLKKTSKKISMLVTSIIVLGASLLPLSSAHAVSYYPGYTCYFRDIAGSCLNYQVQQPAFPYTAITTPVEQNRWNNLNNRRTLERSLHYESKFDKNDYLDDYDDVFNLYSSNTNKANGDWRWYFDENDATYRQYRYQNDNTYSNYAPYRANNNYYEEYEYTRYICTSSSCNSTHIRY